MQLIRQILRGYLYCWKSPLLIGALLGTMLPMMKYEAACSDPEFGRSGRMRILDRLPNDIVVYCVNGFAVGMVVDQLKSRFRPGPRFSLAAFSLLITLAAVAMPLLLLAFESWAIWMRF